MTSELFPASLLHQGDTFQDVADGRIFTATAVSRSDNRWFVIVTPDDGTDDRRYFHSAPVRIFD